MTHPSLRQQIAQRIRLVIAQVWVPRSRSLIEPIDVLPRVADLGSEFKLIDERRWRTGTSNAEWASRAKKAGSITAWRSFKGAGPHGFWIQACPLSDEADAKSAMGDLWTRTLTNLRFRGRLVDSRAGPPVPSLGSDASTIEHEVVLGDERVVTRYVAWRSHNVVNVLAASGQTETWSWDAIASIADAQNRRIQHAGERLTDQSRMSR